MRTGRDLLEERGKTGVLEAMVCSTEALLAEDGLLHCRPRKVLQRPVAAERPHMDGVQVKNVGHLLHSANLIIQLEILVLVNLDLRGNTLRVAHLMKGPQQDSPRECPVQNLCGAEKIGRKIC